MNEIVVYMNDEIRERAQSELVPFDSNEFLDLIESEFKYIFERFSYE